MPIYSYTFQNRKRDLSDVLSTVIRDQPRFISLFPRRADATQQKHEWLEDQIAGRSVTVTGVSGQVLTVSSEDAAKLSIGTQMVVAGDSALFTVTAISGTSVTFKLTSANGSSKSAPTQNDVLNIVSTPIVEGSCEGEETFHQGGTEYNTLQIFRKDIIITGTALAINVYGNVDNQINRQTEFALQELTRDLNRVAIFGHRAERSAAVNGSAGGLYEFGMKAGGLSVNAGGARLDSFVINDGAQAVTGAGGMPSYVLCSPGQARVISQEYRDRLQIVRSDERRGAYVAVIVNDMNGSTMTIIADPDMPDADAWVIDPAGFGISNLKGRAISDEDTSTPGCDSIRRTALGELTFEFKNAGQRLCPIHNLKPSGTALAEVKGGLPSKVLVANTTEDPVNTKEVSA